MNNPRIKLNLPKGDIFIHSAIHTYICVFIFGLVNSICISVLLLFVCISYPILFHSFIHIFSNKDLLLKLNLRCSP